MSWKNGSVNERPSCQAQRVASGGNGSGNVSNKSAFNCSRASSSPRKTSAGELRASCTINWDSR